MRPEARNRVLAACDELAKSAGASSFEEMVDKACVVLESLASFMGEIRTRDQAIAALDKMDATGAEEKLLLAGIRMVPMLARFGTKKVTKDVESNFGSFPTGRKPVLKGEQAMAAIEYIADLHKRGTELGTAIQRAAQRFGVGFRTVERVWNNREEILKNGPEPHFEDVVRRLMS